MVDRMCESPHFGECRRFALLAHNVFDSLRESCVISVAEHVVVPASANSESVELDVVFDDALIIYLASSNGQVCSRRRQLDRSDQIVFKESGQMYPSLLASPEFRPIPGALAQYSKAMPRRYERAKVTLVASSEYAGLVRK